MLPKASANTLDPEAFRHPDRWALQEARCILMDLLSGRGIRAFLIGSRARGDARPFSDIDIALDACGEPIPMDIMALLGERFEESCIPYAVDLVDLHTVPEAWRATLTKEAVIWIG